MSREGSFRKGRKEIGAWFDRCEGGGGEKGRNLGLSSSILPKFEKKPELKQGERSTLKA